MSHYFANETTILDILDLWPDTQKAIANAIDQFGFCTRIISSDSPGIIVVSEEVMKNSIDEVTEIFRIYIDDFYELLEEISDYADDCTYKVSTISRIQDVIQKAESMKEEFESTSQSFLRMYQQKHYLQ